MVRGARHLDVLSRDAGRRPLTCPGCEIDQSRGLTQTVRNIGALINTYTILGVPYYDYSIMGLKTLF